MSEALINWSKATPDAVATVRVSLDVTNPLRVAITDQVYLDVAAALTPLMETLSGEECTLQEIAVSGESHQVTISS